MARISTSENRQEQLLDRIRAEGVDAMGTGKIAKVVMCDPKLSISAKAVYAFFCSCSGGAENFFPCRDNIISYLGINKESYYKYLNELVSAGLIEVQKQHACGGQGKGFDRNNYIIKNMVSRYTCVPNEGKTLSMGGIYSGGYGSVPRSVMFDTRLNLKAKAIYAYLCAFTGSGISAFPKTDDILFHLSLSHATYCKHFNGLLECDYVQRQQRKAASGVFASNAFILNVNPAESLSASPYANFPYTQNSYTEIPDTQKADAQIPYAQKPDTSITSSPANSKTISSKTKNSTVQSRLPKTEEGCSSLFLSCEDVVSERKNERAGKALSCREEADDIWNNYCCIPDKYLDHKDTVRMVVSLLIGRDEINNRETPLYKMAADIITKLLTSKKGTVYRGEELSRRELCELFTKALAESGSNADLPVQSKSLSVRLIKPYIDDAIEALEAAQRTRPIGHVEAYFRSCILDSFQNRAVNQLNQKSAAALAEQSANGDAAVKTGNTSAPGRSRRGRDDFDFEQHHYDYDAILRREA